MKYFQLFRDHPTESFIIRLLACYGLTGLDDSRQFTKSHLKAFGTIQKIEELLQELYVYYVPCKAKIYLENISLKRSITILWQFLRFTNYSLERTESFMVGKKIMVYRLKNNNSAHATIVNHMPPSDLFSH